MKKNNFVLLFASFLLLFLALNSSIFASSASNGTALKNFLTDVKNLSQVTADNLKASQEEFLKKYPALNGKMDKAMQASKSLNAGGQPDWQGICTIEMPLFWAVWLKHKSNDFIATQPDKYKECTIDLDKKDAFSYCIIYSSTCSSVYTDYIRYSVCHYVSEPDLLGKNFCKIHP